MTLAWHGAMTDEFLELSNDKIMNVLLVDFDSKIPNLALMKISAYFKSQGHIVSFKIPNPDIIFISVIFSKNKEKVKRLINYWKFTIPNAIINVGGSGWDDYSVKPAIVSCLPAKIEIMQPDYSLYPDCDYYIGFTTRGCIRNCSFCIVRSKEGYLKNSFDISEICNGHNFKKIKLLDNNILANKNRFIETTTWIKEHKLYVDFNQGLDTRLIDKEYTDILAGLKIWPDIKIAFDSMTYKNDVFKALSLMKESGINIRSKVRCYVYCHGDEQYDDAVTRCNLLKEWGTVPFVMVDPTGNITQRVKDLRRWGTRAPLTMSMDISEYNNKYRSKQTITDQPSLETF